MDEGQAQTTGAQFGKYRIVRRVGEGSFGVVFEALLPGPMGFAKRVAIKKIRSKLVDGDPKFVHAMVNEARIGGLLHHANVVDILEFDRVGEHCYMAMEYVDGATLSEIVDTCRRRGVLLPRFAVVDLGIQICKGLHFAHQLTDHDGRPLHLVHRDLKPSNVIVDREGIAKICDFGIARAATNLFRTSIDGLVKGTPRYMSPEQVAGDELDARSDVFAVAVLLYEVITGHPLFSAPNLPGLINEIMSGIPRERLDRAEAALPGAARILRRALLLDRDSRYDDARSLGDALRELGLDHPPQADMSEVIGRLLPAVDRTESREIADSAGLEQEFDSTDIDDLSMDADSVDANAIPLVPAEAGWQQFTAAFSGGVQDEAAVEPPAPVAEPEVAPPPAPVSTPVSPEPTPARGRAPGWIILLVVAAVVVLVILLFSLRPEGGQEEESPAVPSTTPVTDTRPVVEEPTPAADPPPSVDPTPEPVEEPEITEERAEEPTEEEERPEPTETPPEPTPAPPPAEPGTVSLTTRPWADIYVDGVLIKGDTRLKAHALDGGRHEVRLVCSSRGNSEKVFSVEIDGQDASLGCWDFNTMDVCQQVLAAPDGDDGP